MKYRIGKGKGLLTTSSGRVRKRLVTEMPRKAAPGLSVGVEATGKSQRGRSKTKRCMALV